MKIHHEGYKIIVISFFALLVLEILIMNFFPYTVLSNTIAIALGLVVLYFIIRFFRFPFRWLEENKNVIYAPADGKIVVLEEINENKYLHEKCIQISIFMSPLNVHVNFYPISGEVVQTDYFEGDKKVAWHPKSSDLNEHAVTIIEDTQQRKVLVKQIAGAMARRIVCIAEQGDKVKQGEELGIIKFGSRVDILLPINVKINVDLNDKVKAKETILAFFE